MSEPGLLARIFGRLAYEFAQVQPLLPTYIHIILAALFPIYVAAHGSLSRPSSAAKPTKKQEKDALADDDEEDEESKPRMEGLTPQDAIIFPLTAGVALTGLYFFIKWDKELLNKLMNWYMSLAGVYGLIKFLSDGSHLIHSFIFPTYYSDGVRIWSVKQAEHKVVPLDSSEETAPKTTPLPGILSHIPLPTAVRKFAWAIRSIPQNGVTVKFYLHNVFAIRTNINLYQFGSFITGFLLVLYFTFVSKPWYLTNLMGFAFSYTALQIISPTTFGTGSLVLIGLFFYDIYMVFFTPMMVTVAKNLDIPIKLLFPRPSESPSKQQFSMLGLGDIVLPGIVMGLALRFDLYLHYLRKQRPITVTDEKSENSKSNALAKPEIYKAPFISPSKQWANQFWTTSRFGFTLPATIQVPESGRFSKTYFTASLVGYVGGMIATLVAMQVSNHPQPALLYLVPGVLISLWGTASIRRELKVMWDFTEEEEEEEEANAPEKVNEGDENVKGEGALKAVEKSKPPRKSFFASMFSSADDTAHNQVARRAADGNEKSESKNETNKEDKSSDGSATEKVKDLERKFQRDHKNDILFFSVSRLIPPGEGPNRGRAIESDKSHAVPRWVSPVNEHTNGEPAEKRLRTA